MISEKQPYKRRKCEWKLSDNPDDSIYETSCGQEFILIDGTPEWNDYNYCPYCGHEIKNPPEPERKLEGSDNA